MTLRVLRLLNTETVVLELYSIGLLTCLDVRASIGIEGLRVSGENGRCVKFYALFTRLISLMSILLCKARRIFEKQSPRS